MRRPQAAEGRLLIALAVSVVVALPAPAPSVIAGEDLAPSDGHPDSPSAPAAATTQTLSPAGGDADSQQVAVGADGSAYVVWIRSDAGVRRVQIRRRSAAGTLSPVQTLSGPGQDAFEPQVAIAPDGAALVVWSRWVHHSFHRIKLIRRAPSGELGPVQTLSADVSESSSPQLAVDRDGNAVVVWSASEGPADLSAPSRIELRRRFASGQLGPIVRVSRLGAGQPQVAMDRIGNAFVIWLRSDGLNSRIEMRRFSTAGRLGVVQTLSADGHNTSDPQIAVDSHGNALAVWSREGIGAVRIQLRRRAAWGGLSAIQTLSATQTAVRPQIAVNRHDSAIVVWQRDNGHNWKVQLRRRAPTGAVSDVQTLSPPGMDAFFPNLAIDAANSAWVTWHLFDDSNFSVQVRRRTNEGHLDPIVPMSDPGPRAGLPVIDARSVVLVAWAEFDGTNARIEAGVP